MSFLELQNLKITFVRKNGNVTAVRSVNLKVVRCSRHALIGQTGAGKSILGLSILRLLPENARITGKVLFQSRDLLSCTEKELRQIRGKEIMVVFQNPLATLNPVLTIEKQLCEIPMYHEGLNLCEAKARAQQMLELCGLREPQKVMQSHSFEMSGGMLQRVAIAMGIICRPSLLIADEPFKGLDVSLQKQVAGILYKVCRELEITLLIITHNLKVAKSLCDFISVMHKGKIVETAAVKDFFSSPCHPYSKRLVNAFNAFSGQSTVQTSSSGQKVKRLTES